MDRYQTSEAGVAQRSFINKVYAWMGLGLFVTGTTSALVVSSDTLLNLVFSSSFTFYGLLFAELALVWYLSATIEKLSVTTANLAYVVYAVLNGITLSVIFLAYTYESIATTFFVTAGTFGVMALYGYVTKRDLSGWGSFLIMGLIGLILASLVNLFMQNSTIYWVSTYIGIFIFMGLTAYDMNKLKNIYLDHVDNDTYEKAAIMGALTLYLDFVNLFLYILRILGRKR